MSTKKLISLRQFARLAGTTPQTVTYHVRQGHLKVYTTKIPAFDPNDLPAFKLLLTENKVKKRRK